jgi:hypothetical protein
MAIGGSRKQNPRWQTVTPSADYTGSRIEKACRGRRCGRLFENNRTTAGRRSAVIPASALGRRIRSLAISKLRGRRCSASMI